LPLPHMLRLLQKRLSVVGVTHFLSFLVGCVGALGHCTRTKDAKEIGNPTKCSVCHHAGFQTLVRSIWAITGYDTPKKKETEEISVVSAKSFYGPHLLRFNGLPTCIQDYR